MSWRVSKDGNILGSLSETGEFTTACPALSELSNMWADGVSKFSPVEDAEKIEIVEANAQNIISELELYGFTVEEQA